MNWDLVTSSPCQLGESPFWHPHEQMLYWVDIIGKSIHRSNIYMDDVDTWHVPSEPGCIAPAFSGGLVIAMRDGIYRSYQWGGALVKIAQITLNTDYIRANDGKCDSLGRFWVGTMDESGRTQSANLYCIDAREEGAPEVSSQINHIRNAVTANGLAWSPDGKIIYWADTPTHQIKTWDFEPETRLLSNPALFASFSKKVSSSPKNLEHYQGRPDGAAVDINGDYYVAMYEGAKICQFSQGGTLQQTWPTPARCPTMPCFGGEDLQTLYITTARQKSHPEELALYPNSGCLFSMRMQTPGLPVNFFSEFS